MEQGLRDCCRSIRIGKILIQSDEETQRAKVYYAKFPPDIYRRKVLLMYPILSKCLSSPCTVRLIWTVSALNLKENFQISGALIRFIYQPVPEYRLVSLHQHECRANHLGMPAFVRKVEALRLYKFNFLNFSMRKYSKQYFSQAIKRHVLD